MLSPLRSISLLICLTVLCASFVGAQEGASQNLFRIFEKGKVGFIDSTGKVIVQPQLEYAGDFSEGLAPVYFRDSQADEKNSTGFINDKGEFVIKPILGRAEKFSDGVAIIVFDFLGIPDSYPRGKYGAIDKTGKLIIEPNFKLIFPFKDGIAFAVTSDGKQCFIDKNGKIIFTPAVGLLNPISDGLGIIEIDNKYGYLNQNGDLVIKPQFTYAQAFSEGLAAVSNEGKFLTSRTGLMFKKGEKQTLKYSYIDKSGNIAFNIETELVYPFSEGLAAIYENGSYGFIDKTGKIVVKPQLGAGTSHTFSEGLCKVFIRTDEGFKLAYIDKTGTVVIKPNFDNGYDFNNGLALVYKGNYPKTTSAYIDKKGRVVWQETK